MLHFQTNHVKMSKIWRKVTYMYINDKFYILTCLIYLSIFILYLVINTRKQSNINVIIVSLTIHNLYFKFRSMQPTRNQSLHCQIQTDHSNSLFQLSPMNIHIHKCHLRNEITNISKKNIYI